MPSPSRIESLPSEVLHLILRQCARQDVANLTLASHRMRIMCHGDLSSRRLPVNITAKTLKWWSRYFHKPNTCLARGGQALAIKIKIDMWDILRAFADLHESIFNLDIRPIHPDSLRVLPLPSSLRVLWLYLPKTKVHPGSEYGPSPILLLLLRNLPDQCPLLSELKLSGESSVPPTALDECVQRLRHLTRLKTMGDDMSNLPSCLSLLPGSITHLDLMSPGIPSLDEFPQTIPCIPALRSLEIQQCPPRGWAKMLMILARGGAHRLVNLSLNGKEDPGVSGKERTARREALARGIEEFGRLCAPLRTIHMAEIPAWKSSLHLPLLHASVASTLTTLSLWLIPACLFPTDLSWPHLDALRLYNIRRVGYNGELSQTIFPVLRRVEIVHVDEIRITACLFPAMEDLTLRHMLYPHQEQKIIQHGLKRFTVESIYEESGYRTILDDLREHRIEEVRLVGQISKKVYREWKSGRRIFPEYPNVGRFYLGTKSLAELWTDDDPNFY